MCMNYEEKIKMMKEKGQINYNLLEPIDFFRFVRDGGLHLVEDKRKDKNHAKYDVYCYQVFSAPDAYVPEQRELKEKDFQDFIKRILDSAEQEGYMLLENKLYKIVLDLVEIYE